MYKYIYIYIYMYVYTYCNRGHPGFDDQLGHLGPYEAGRPQAPHDVSYNESMT